MADPGLTLAGDFPRATREDWLRLVDKVLKGADPGKRLVRRTYDGIEVQPLYAREPCADPWGAPGMYPFVRGSTTTGQLTGWDVRQRHAHPDPARVNAQIREDLAAGVTSIQLQIDSAPAMRHEPPDGCCVLDLDDLDAALSEVDLSRVPLGVEGARFGIDAALLVALWRRRGIAPSEARGALNVDPMGAAARGVGIDMDAALARAGEIAAYADAHLPLATAMLCDGHVYHAGGASEAQELAAGMATAVAYLRAAERAGLPPDRTAPKIAFRFACDADVFLTIAKLRAARALWARICDACGTSGRGMRVVAMTGTRMLSRRDPWNNLLRTTLGGFAAALGGADALTVLPFDHALGPAGSRARRLARNIQLVLMEECALGRPIDPLGGAGYIEDLTRRLASEAWSLFQAIEGGGGMAQMLMKGTIQDWISGTLAERMANIARRAEPIIGVSEFPLLEEPPLAIDTWDATALADRAESRLATATDTVGLSFAEMIDASSRGHVLQYRGHAAGYTPLPPTRLAQAFEGLRDRADAISARTGTRLRVRLHALGSPADYAGRASFARNLFAAGGIEAVEDSAPAGSVVAVCGSDAAYAELGAAAVQELKQAGCRRVWVLGRPAEAEAAMRAAGADAFVRIGDDAMALLDEALEILGDAP